MKQLFWMIVFGLVLMCSSVDGTAAERPIPTPPQALANLSSSDSATQDAAANALMATGDVTLLTKLEKMRTNADRSVRMVMKLIIDLLKNKAKLNSVAADERRSAATDLGSLGRPVAVPWMEGALEHESDRWVRYTLASHCSRVRVRLIQIAADRPTRRAASTGSLDAADG